MLASGLYRDKEQATENWIAWNFLHHDNADAHTAAATLRFLAKQGVRLMTHPQYFPDLALCDCFQFSKVKGRICGKCFSCPEDAVAAYLEEIQKLNALEWDNCFTTWFNRMKLV